MASTIQTAFNILDAFTDEQKQKFNQIAGIKIYDKSAVSLTSTEQAEVDNLNSLTSGFSNEDIKSLNELSDDDKQISTWPC